MNKVQKKYERINLKLLLLTAQLCAISNIVLAGVHDLLISEVCPVLDTVIQDGTGDFADWAELYNPGTDTVNLKGLIFSDNINDLYNFEIDSEIKVNPNGFIILWADNEPAKGANHLGFKLSKNETFIISDTSGVLIDSVTIHEVTPNVSYGRASLSKSGQWNYFTPTSPGSINNTTSFTGKAGQVAFSISGGFYNSPQNISLTKSGTDEDIYYTLNFNDPVPGDTNTFLYDGSPSEIPATGAIRARCIRSGYLPGDIVSNIYFINQEYSLPVMATITDPDNIYGPKGIYSHPWNEGYIWERFAQHQYFINNQLRFSANSGLRIQGGNSVGMSKKSFRQHYRDQYGDDRLDYALFDHTNVQSFKHIVLRAGYDDDITTPTGTLLRDPLSVEIWRLSGNLSSASSFAVLTLNNNYRGIYNLRESVDDEFIKDHLGIDNFDMIRYQKYGPDLVYGNLDEWNKLDFFFRNKDFTLEKMYDSACAVIDMDVFLDLLAFVHCTGFRSWTWGASAYREKAPGAKWKWVMWDTDRSYSEINWNGFTDYNSTINEKWCNFIPKALINNPLFKIALINRTCDFLNYYLLPSFSYQLLDSLAEIISAEIPNEKARWNNSSDWTGNIADIKTFLTNRPQIVKNQMKSYFSLTNPHTIELNIEGKGKILVNSLTIEKFPWTGEYFETIPISLTALPKPGYKFEQWNNGITNSAISDVNLESDSSLTAIFIEDPDYIGNVIINEIMYNPSKDYPCEDWFEIYNPGKSADLSGWWFTDDNPDNRFIFPAGTYLNENGYLVISKNMNSFNNIIGNISNITGSFGLGPNGFGLGQSAECIKLYNSEGTIVDSVCYTDKSPWPVMADGTGPSLQLINVDLDNDRPQNWNTSLVPLYTPGSVNIINNTLITIPQYKKNIEINVYPNPFSNRINVFIPGFNDKNALISVFSLTGRVCYQKTLETPGEYLNAEIDLGETNQGIYFIKIQSAHCNISHKIIKLNK